ncbi:MAG: MBL fold metallo-hydrolase [Candidatus Lokiarchaeota archaeon]|nr:MBL fold metallo-hydrolase [Candidatus Lokiarchaeota archaeon]
MIGHDIVYKLETASTFLQPNSTIMMIASINMMLEIEHFDEIVCVKTATEQAGQAIMWVYAYRIGNLLFDAGCGNAREEVRNCPELEGIERIIISHYHEDHIGCIRAFEDVVIYAPEQSIELIQNPDELGEFFQYVWGQPEKVEKVLPVPDVIIEGDFEFEAIPLPGHCKNMYGIYEPERKWLFSADAIPLPSKKTIAMPEENIPQIIATMKRIQNMDIEVLFDGHRGPIENPKEHIQVRIDFLHKIKDEILSYHEQGKSVIEIQTALELEGPWYMDLTEGRFGIDHFINSVIKDSIPIDNEEVQSV